MIAGNRISMTARFPRCHRHGLCCHRSFFWRNGLMGLAVYIMSCVGFWEVFIAGCKLARWRRYRGYAKGSPTDLRQTSVRGTQ